jgi:hypothetical protein
LNDHNLTLRMNAVGCSNGTVTGTVVVRHTSTTVTVRFFISNGYVVRETYVYVGASILPASKNVRPGSYPYNILSLQYKKNNTYQIASALNCVYVIAYATLCY